MFAEALADRVAALSSEHPEEVAAAAAWLAAHPELSRRPLRRLLRCSPDDPAAPVALDVLARIGDERDVGALAACLRSPGTAWDAAQALARHRSPRAGDALRQALDDPRGGVAGAAAVALGGRGDQAARQGLERLLSHPDPDVRYRAVLGLASIGLEPSTAALRAGADAETDLDVRALIRHHLGW